MNALNQSTQLIRQLEQQLATCMVMHRHNLRRQIKKITDLLKQQQAVEKPLAALSQQIQRSAAQYQQRLALLPVPSYPAELPVSRRKDDIAKAIAAHQVVIICGETGSGKTTQLPKICLELGRGVAGLIGHTQPRRIAARTVASRIAQELDSPLGQVVGYKVRFNDQLSTSSYIKLMTDGILLAETQGDPFLTAYDTIIIDEAHERSLNIDFLLGFLKQLLTKRADLKVIVTSATIDATRFSAHFDDAPVIEVSGRMFPVEVRYRPLGRAGLALKEASIALDDDTDIEVLGQDITGVKRQPRQAARWLEEDDEEEDLEAAIFETAAELLRQGDGDILVFLPGEREIREAAEYLRQHLGRSPALRSVEILPLFARLSIADQQKIFKTGGARRIVLATNVAETSLTVPGIKYVIDAGLARVSRYSPRAKVEQLQIEKISQAAAKQRAGRCGRVANGICVRLYSEADFNQRAAYTEPEILRSSLAAVILRMAALRLGDVATFPFIEMPSTRLINDGYLLLQELGAVDATRHITDIGRQLAKLPVDPRVGRMILAANHAGCLHEILVIASALSIQDPRERPMDKREAADQAHARLMHAGGAESPSSDFMMYLKLWDFFEQALKNKQSNKALINQCHQYFLSFLRLKEWRELYSQLRDIVLEMGYKVNQQPAAEKDQYRLIHTALLAGLLGNIGFKDGENESYAGARGIRFLIAPGSALKKTRPKWVVAAELVDTSKLYARCVAKIDPDWIEPLASQLTQSHYTDPRWDRKLAQVVAWERVSLYGLTVVPKRRVHYGPINPEQSREIFIREALANMEFDTKAAFFEANRRMIADIEALEHKARRQDVLVDEQTLFAFYAAIIPAGIINGAGFEKWRSEAEKQHPQLLYLTKAALMRHAAAEVTENQFPETLIIDGVSLDLKYRFAPGHTLDGITATIPLALLNQLDMIAAEWLVPGMLREKITTMIKLLPKSLRRMCVPVPEFITAFLQQASAGRGSLHSALAHYIEQQTTLKFAMEEWIPEAIPPHLMMNFRIVDEKQQELGMGRDWQLLKTQLGQAAQLTFRTSSPEIEKDGLQQWDFGDLPASLSFNKAGRSLTGYPALEDHGDSVAIKLFDTAAAAQQSHRAGVCRLMRFELKMQLKQLEKNLLHFNQYALQLRHLISPEVLREDLLSTIADRAFIGEEELPRTNAAFMQLKVKAKARLPAVAEATGRIVNVVAQEYALLADRLGQGAVKSNKLRADLQAQLDQLLYPQCFSQTPWTYLQHMPRYIKAMRLRVEKQPNHPDRDGKHAASVHLLWQQWQLIAEKQRKLGPVSTALLDFRWLIEELRVSLFAQELKTPFPVSIKRLEKILAELAG